MFGSLTMISVHPVAQGGIEAKIGAKKMETRKQRPAVIAVRPVLPPSTIPAPDSMKAVTVDVSSKAPMEMENASIEYAIVERGKLPVSGSTTPEILAMLDMR